MWNSSLNNAIRHLIPFRLRRLKFLAWITVSVSWLVDVYERLRSFRTESLRQAYLSPQVASLERYLNDKLNSELIEIVDGEYLGPWIFVKDLTPVFWLDQWDSFLFNSEQEVDFIVLVPIELISYTKWIAAVVNRYKLPGKKFNIYLITYG
ncbi:MAG: hypothetical protein ACNA7V_06655 [Bacteroidales bacterium]